MYVFQSSKNVFCYMGLGFGDVIGIEIESIVFDFLIDSVCIGLQIYYFLEIENY